jgi:hypothetical protein
MEFWWKIQSLGIKYDLNKTECWVDNFKEKIIMIKKTSRQLDFTKSFTTGEGDSIKIFSLTYFGAILNSPPRSSTWNYFRNSVRKVLIFYGVVNQIR